MASALYSTFESATASPFPSPSSSFLTPPTPGAHEFAIKPPPASRFGRKGSATALNNTTSNTSSPRSSVSSHSELSQSKRSSGPLPSTFNEDCQAAPSPPEFPMAVTPTLSDSSNLPSLSSLVTPTNHTSPLPPSTDSGLFVPIQGSVPSTNGASSSPTSLDVPTSSTITPHPRTNLVNRGSRPPSTASTTSATSSASVFDPSLFSFRPAPPSPGGGSTSTTPGISRRPSTRSKPGSSSKPVSRANSLRNHHCTSSPRVSSTNACSSPVLCTLAARGEGAVTPQNSRVSAGSQLGTTFSSSLPSPTKSLFDMGITASSPTIQDISATSVTAISSEGSGSSTTSTSTSTSTADTQPQHLASSHQNESDKIFIKIRDFGFQPTDERHNGQGPLVPKTNRVGRMNRRLGGRTYSTSSISSSEDATDEDDDGDGWGWNSGGFGSGGLAYCGGWTGGGRGGRFSWAMSSTAGVGTGAATAATIFDQEKAYAAAAANLSAAVVSKANGNTFNGGDDYSYPTRGDMDRNFLDSESEEFYDAEDDDDRGIYEGVPSVGGDENDDDEEDEPLYSGLYRALYSFEPEGTAEMRLVEDQIVRVVGRGGGVGWAVVVVGVEPVELLDAIEKDSSMVDGIGDDGALKATTRHALVPESYLEPYKLDWELDEEGSSAVATSNNLRTVA